MPLPLITDTIRAANISISPNGHVDANVMHFRKTGAITYAAAIAILDPLLFAFWNTSLGGQPAIKAYLPTTWALQEIHYTPLDGTTATTVIGHAMAGTNVSDSLPLGSSLVITWYTALRGRAHRGRTYLPEFGESNNQTLGQVDPTQRANIQTSLNAWLVTFVASGVTPVVASYKNSTAQDVTTLLARGVWHYQRRRAN